MKTILGMFAGFSMLAVTVSVGGCATDAPKEDRGSGSAAVSASCREAAISECMRASAECAEPNDPEKEDAPTAAEQRACCEQTASFSNCEDTTRSEEAPAASEESPSGCSESAIQACTRSSAECAEAPEQSGQSVHDCCVATVCGSQQSNE